MIGFGFTCHAPRMRFAENFRVWGPADEFEWNYYNGDHDKPKINGLEVNWHVETDGSVFDYYARCMANMGRPLPTRIPEFSGYWRDQVRSMLWKSDDEARMYVTIAAPPGDGFVAFMSNAVASKMSVAVSLGMSTFATREDAPAPTVDAFLTRHEPLFFSDQAQFWPFYREAEEAAVPEPSRARRKLFR